MAGMAFVDLIHIVMIRKFAALLAASLLCLACMTDIKAQSRYGVIGGINFSTANIGNLNRGTMTQWHAGLTYKLDLPLGFSLQPSLVYNVKGAKVGIEMANFDLSMGYIELPVSLQWGPDLLLFRPFLDVTPYIGYAVNNKFKSSSASINYGNWQDTSLQRFEYGLGLGIGLEIWRFQVIGRYNWNFGSLYEAKTEGAAPVLRDVFSGKNFGGITLSVAFLFGGGRK